MPEITSRPLQSLALNAKVYERDGTTTRLPISRSACGAVANGVRHRWCAETADAANLRDRVTRCTPPNRGLPARDGNIAEHCNSLTKRAYSLLRRMLRRDGLWIAILADTWATVW